MPNPHDPQDPMRQPERLVDAEEAARNQGGAPADAKRRLAEDPDEVPNATDPEGEPNTDAGHTARQRD